MRARLHGISWVPPMLLPLPAAVVNFGRGAWSYRRRTTPAERAAGKRCRKEGPCSTSSTSSAAPPPGSRWGAPEVAVYDPETRETTMWG
jgi:hypothetical protein